jgi:argonaute-like protein implicated in RNA metabolism and viral defense
MGPETPNPLWVRVARGHCPIGTVLGDIMGLTKINYNACRYSDKFPVTLKFADAVGEVLLAAPINCEPRLPFKHYV